MRCGYCGEEYDVGPMMPSDTGLRYLPQGETMYWKHCRESQIHQSQSQQDGESQREMLDKLPVILHDAAKKRNNERARLKRLESKKA